MYRPDASPTLSPELIQRAARGNPQAQNDIVELSLKRVVQWATRLSNPPIPPEDVAHDALMTALERLDTLREPAKFEGWLYGITRRTVVKYRRNSWWKRWIGPSEMDLADTQKCLEGGYLRSEKARLVQEILSKLSMKHREVLVLMLIEGRTGPEVAKLLDIPQGTVRGRLRAAKKKFKEEAQKLGSKIDFNQTKSPPQKPPGNPMQDTLGGTV